MSKWIKYFVYISFLFLIYYLWKAEFLFFPKVENYFFLLVSFFFLFGGFITKSLVWVETLRSKQYPVSFRHGFVSVGLSELGKYIPGKLWIILGRAGYVSSQYGYKLKDSSYLSLYTQVITIWTGLLIGGLGAFFVDLPPQWVIILTCGIFILSLVLFIPEIQVYLIKIFNRIFKRNITIPYIYLKDLKKIVFYYFFDWIVRIVGFAFLLASLSGNAFSFEFLPAYPLSITLGILSMIAPGGLGVREGILIFWMHKTGMPTESATAIAMTTRLWMLFGELVIFASAIILDKFLKRK